MGLPHQRYDYLRFVFDIYSFCKNNVFFAYGCIVGTDYRLYTENREKEGTVKTQFLFALLFPLFVEKLNISSPILAGEKMSSVAKVVADVSFCKMVAGYRHSVGADKALFSKHFPDG